jgi:hypothetical protein
MPRMPFLKADGTFQFKTLVLFQAGVSGYKRLILAYCKVASFCFRLSKSEGDSP